MQAQFFPYNSASSTSGQTSYDGTSDQGTWQQPSNVQTSSQHQMEHAYYTGIITGAAQSYYTKTSTQGYMTGTASSGNVAAAGGNYTRGTKTSTVKSPQAGSGNANIAQTQAQFGNSTSQYVASNQYQGSTVGDMNISAADGSYYGYPNDQFMTSAGNVGISSDSYSSMGIGNNTSGEVAAFDSSAMSMTTNSGAIGMANNNVMNSGGGMSMGNGTDMGMNTTGNINMMSDSGTMGMGVNSSANMGTVRGNFNTNHNVNMGMGNSGQGMGMSSGENINSGNNTMKSGMGANWGNDLNNSMDNSANSYDGYKYNDYMPRNNSNNSHYGNFRGRGSRFQNQPRPASGRGSFNSRGFTPRVWRNSSGFRNNAGGDYYSQGRGGMGKDFGYYGSREMSRGREAYHGSTMGGRNFHGVGGDLTISLNATNHNQWCFLRKNFGKIDNDLAEHLFEVHDKFCNQCKERSDAKKTTRKRKVSQESEGMSVTQDEQEEELTEEELKMKELMGFAGFKTTKFSKPKDISYNGGAVERAKSPTRLSSKAEDTWSETSTALTVEERRAMASLGGFSVFSKVSRRYIKHFTNAYETNAS